MKGNELDAEHNVICHNDKALDLQLFKLNIEVCNNSSLVRILS